MANKWGVHLSNYDGKVESPELEAMIACGCSNYTLLNFQADNVARLRESSPDGIILVRFYLPNWREKNPVDWAYQCAAMYKQKRGLEGWTLHDMKVDVTPANEQNLAVEGGDTSRGCFEMTAWWNSAWYDTFVRLTGIPHERTQWPAWAYGNYDDWDPIEAPRGYTGIQICKEAIKKYGKFGGHPYPHSWEGITNKWDGGRDQLWTEDGIDKPIFVSEFCCPDVMAQDAPEMIVAQFKYFETRPQIVGATAFIWNDPHNSMMNNNLSRNPRIAEAIKNAPKKTLGGQPTVPTVGQGFQKCIPFIGNFVESEVYHFAGTPNETSLAVAERGYATWRRATNATTCVNDDGFYFSDFGNNGTGKLVRIY